MFQDSTTPPEGFENEPVWLPKFFVNNDVIEGISFRNCRLLGPGIMALLGSTTMNGCSFPGPIDSFVWKVEPNRTIYGAMGFLDCQFIGCKFEPSLGLAVDDELLAMISGAITE